jgi:hypothetical protein
MRTRGFHLKGQLVGLSVASERRCRVPLAEMSGFAERNGTPNSTSRVVTRTPKIDRESQQNHSKTHNAIEHQKTDQPPEQVRESILCRPPESGNTSQQLTTLRTDDPLKEFRVPSALELAVQETFAPRLGSQKPNEGAKCPRKLLQLVSHQPTQGNRSRLELVLDE